MKFTRRTFSRICGASLLFGRPALRAKETVPLSFAALPDGGTGWQRRYRADAQVILLSIPVLHRNGVGDGSVNWRESSTENGAVLRLLEFTGRSAPEHAAGLNRFGFIQELSRTVDRVQAESIYFGLMTSSPEESTAEAKKALHSTSKEIPFSAIEARISEGSIETRGAHFLAPARTSAADRGALMESAHEALSGVPKRKENLRAAEPMPRPFLHALAELLGQPGSSQTQYEYNGRIYNVDVQRSPDPKAATAFRQQGLIPQTAAVVRIAGSLWREHGGKPIEFGLWLEEGAVRPIPLRIAYQPKSYLRLTFEALA